MSGVSLAPDEMQELFTDALGEHVEASEIQWDQLTVTLDAEGYVEAARLCKEDERLACDFFDCISGVDEREDGFSVVTILYSTEHHHRVLLRHRCEGGRDTPVAPSLTDLYRGADWHEREAWDMFGIEFDGHPGLAPRILTTENFEGWPLRKDFYLATREAKPWPGIKEPLEMDEEGNVIEREKGAEPGGAPGPMELDEAMGEQARRAAGLLDEEPAEIEVEGETEDVDAEAPRTTASDEGVGAAPEEEASARAERARRKAREMREKKAQEKAQEQAAAEQDDEQKVEEPVDEADAAATAQDPRVSAPEERGEEAGERAEQEKREPDTYDADEETRTERAERAVEESSAEAPDEVVETGQGGPPGVPATPEHEPEAGTTPEHERSRGTKTGEGPGTQPAQDSDEAAPGAEAGEPPTAQEPGEAPIDGGVHESADEAADAGPGPSGGQRPDSDEATEVDDPMPDDAADRSRTLPEDPSSSSDSGRTPDPSSSSDSGRTPDDEEDDA